MNDQQPREMDAPTNTPALPCPWCGIADVGIESEQTVGRKVVGFDENNGPVYWAECQRCLARAPLVDWAADAISKWNTRANPQPRGWDAAKYGNTYPWCDVRRDHYVIELEHEPGKMIRFLNLDGDVEDRKQAVAARLRATADQMSEDPVLADLRAQLERVTGELAAGRGEPTDEVIRVACEAWYGKSLHGCEIDESDKVGMRAALLAARGGQ